MTESPSPSKQKKWSWKKVRAAVLAFAGPILILGTYVVKEHLRDGVRDEITAIEEGRERFLMRTSQNAVLDKLRDIGNNIADIHDMETVFSPKETRATRWLISTKEKKVGRVRTSKRG